MKEVEIKNIICSDKLNVMVFGSRIQAGFPSPAQGYFSEDIDLNKELVPSPASTYCAEVTGDSMKDCGIFDGDLLIVDKSLTPRSGNIAVCFLDGEFTVKKLRVTERGIDLVPGNKDYPVIHVTEDNSFQIWGVVSHVIKNTLRNEV